jgi:hypothetical protein
MVLPAILKIMSDIFVTVLSYFMTLLPILQIMSVILLQRSSILQNHQSLSRFHQPFLRITTMGLAGRSRGVRAGGDSGEGTWELLDHTRARLGHARKQAGGC